MQSSAYLTDAQLPRVKRILDFHFDDNVRASLAGRLCDLPRDNGLVLPHDDFDAAMERLRTRFLERHYCWRTKPCTLLPLSAYVPTTTRASLIPKTWVAVAPGS